MSNESRELDPISKGALQGCSLVDREKLENGVVREQFGIEKGFYNATFGLRRYGEHEDEWLSTASDSTEDQEKGFQFDYNNPDVVRISEELFEGETEYDDYEKFHELVDRYNSLIPSAQISSVESFKGLGDIVRKGEGTCAAKSDLLGALVSKFTNLSAEDIHGQHDVVRERVSYPFGHQWLRVGGKKHVFLIDPMYGRFTGFERFEDRFVAVDDNARDFENYTPSAYPTSFFLKEVSAGPSVGTDLIQSHDNPNEYETFVTRDDALSYQVGGSLTIGFEIDKLGSKFNLYDKCVRLSSSDNAHAYFPLIGIREV